MFDVETLTLHFCQHRTFDAKRPAFMHACVYVNVCVCTQEYCMCVCVCVAFKRTPKNLQGDDG